MTPAQRRPGLFSVIAVLAVACTTPAAAPVLPDAPVAVAAGPQPIAIVATPVPLNPRDPGRTRAGELTYAGGVALSARGTSRFGGVSGIDIRWRENGRQFLAVTDQGDLLQADLRLDGAGRLQGLGDATIQPLLDETGLPLQGKTDADAEGLVAFPGDDFAVSFERRHRVRAYERPGARAGSFPWAASAPADLPDNQGLEALAHPPASMPTTLVLGAEGGRTWRCAQRACLEGARAAIAPGYSLTGLDALPGGWAAVAVFRAYDPFRGMRAIVAWTPNLLAGAPFRPLARLEPPLTTDNFEAIAAVPHAGGWRIYLMSDDNFSSAQRTLLLAFDWKPPPEACPPEGRTPQPRC
jgi:hypothetical protein